MQTPTIDVLAVIERHVNHRADRAETTTGSQELADRLLREAIEAHAALVALLAAVDLINALSMENDGATCEWPEAVAAATALRAARQRIANTGAKP